MTAFQIFYYGLLVLWLALPWPALRLYGWKRNWLLVVAAAGLLATVNEVWQIFWVVNAIRIDVLLFAVVLLALYASAAVVLFGAYRRRAALLLALAVVVIGGGLGYEWVAIGREGKHLTAVFDKRNALLFQAKFRDRQIYERYFGPFSAAAAGQPVGHWQAKGPSHFTRLIANGRGQAWLFYRCGTAECAFGPAESGLQRVVDARRGEIAWQAVLRPEIGDALAVRILREGADDVRVEARGQAVPFAKTPPPIEPAPAPQKLEFAGPFAAADCTGPHTKVRQVWLWRDGDRLFAVGIFQTLVPERRAQFVSPVVLGEGRKEGGRWAFAWDQHGKPSTAALTPAGESVSLTLALRGQPPETLELPRKAIFRDDAIDFAPLTTVADWQDWFATVLVGHFFSADIPGCG
jgi:hypothetical protein